MRLQKELIEEIVEAIPLNEGRVKVKTSSSHKSFKALVKDVVSYFSNEIGIKSGISVNFDIILSNKQGAVLILSPKQLRDIFDGGDFEVTLRLTSKGSLFLETIAHELTHVKQMEEGLVELRDDESLYWKGEKIIELSNLSTLKREGYENLPWEVDARRNQAQLAIDFIKSKEFEKLKDKYQGNAKASLLIGILEEDYV